MIILPPRLLPLSHVAFCWGRRDVAPRSRPLALWRIPIEQRFSEHGPGRAAAAPQHLLETNIFVLCPSPTEPETGVGPPSVSYFSKFSRRF